MSHSLADVITPRTTSREVHKFKGQTLLSEADYGIDKRPKGKKGKKTIPKTQLFLYITQILEFGFKCQVFSRTLSF